MIEERITQIKDFTNKDDGLITIRSDADISQAAELMSRNKIGCLMVTGDNNNLAGMLSERDMITKVLTKSLPMNGITVKEVMTRAVITCDVRTTVNKANHLMHKHNIRHLPVIENGIPIGIISSRDMLRHRLESSKAMQTAAEQLAMLPTNLKQLDIENISALAINKIPESLGARNAVFCLTSEKMSKPIIKRNGCKLPDSELLKIANSEKTGHSIKITTENGCRGCKFDGKNILKTFIPQKVYSQHSDKNQTKITKGFLCMCRDTNDNEVPDNSQLYKASLLRQILNSCLTHSELYKSYRIARRNSETDQLTGLGSRKLLDDVLNKWCSLAARHKDTFSVAIIDIDYFKQINDTAGHAAGDRILREFADLLKKNTRTEDYSLTRFGGDEFVLILPKTPLDNAMILLERIRKQAKNINIKGAKSLTISCGAAEWDPQSEDTPESILEKADKALYKSKTSGRDLITTYPVPREAAC